MNVANYIYSARKKSLTNMRLWLKGQIADFRRCSRECPECEFAWIM